MSSEESAVWRGVAKLDELRGTHVMLSAYLEPNGKDVAVKDGAGERLAVVPRASWERYFTVSVGLNCQKHRPASERRACPLGLGHLGDCEFPTEVP